MKDFPSTLVAAHKTDTFDETSIPDKLLQRHRITGGMWGFLRVIEGKLRFVTMEDDEEETELVLTSRTPGIIEPEVPHRVEPVGPVKFYIQFFREAAPTS